MKKYIKVAALVALTLGGCTKLDVNVESQLTSENFPVTPDAFVAATGTVYQKFNAGFGVDIWRMYELTSEEAIITARNGGYYDQGRYQLCINTTGYPITLSFKGPGNGLCRY
ncbi:hypothetical protein G7074_19915 [Pedobacter sp. HDW13]|uniref:hypothetical protein n=1 Tax=Pedobacter sp. HDW13 TaxID=2714940 RepID=UPI001409AA74|nr:hypothetical protein [Pedobacter sp. HDW13]QIL41328.1 hypothetical protein G7074_19915 [Pedobacter sp. HDW13]